MRVIAPLAAVLVLAGAPPSSAQLPLAMPLEVRVHRPGAFVYAVAQGTDGHLWIATEGGAYRFDGTKLTSLAEAPRGPTNHVQGDAAGGMWLASAQTPGVLRVGQGAMRRYGEGDGLPGGDVRAIGLGPDAAIWVATTEGLARFAAGTWRRIEHGGPSPLRARGFERGADGSLWLRAADEWLRLDAQGVSERRTPERGTVPFELLIAGGPGVREVAARALRAAEGIQRTTTLVDRAGNVYVGTVRGLFVATADTVFRVGASEGLPDDHVRRLYEDAEGNVWVTTHGGGLAQLVRRPLAALTVRHGLVGNTPFAVAQTADGTIWVTTVAGLNRLAPGGAIALAGGGRAPRLQMRSLLAARDGTLWIATENGPLLHYEPATDRFTPHPLPDALEREYVSALGELPGGLAFATTGGRVLWFEAGRFREVRAHVPACGNGARATCPAAVSAFAPRRAGGLWAPTFGDGLAVLQDEALRPSGIAAPPRAKLWSVYEEPGGRLWLGADNGLFLHEGGRVREIRAYGGAELRPVFHVIGGPDGALWLGGLRGVTRLEPAAGDGQRRALLYSTADAMPSDLVMGIADPTAIRAQDGRLWFVTVTGLAVFEPAPPRRQVPAPHLERIDADAGRFHFPFLGPRVSLPPGRGDLMVTYGAAVLADPHRVRFAYRLEGLDTRWTDAGERRVAHYANLRPGRYTFRVRAFRDDAPEAAREAAAEIVLAPHFHQTRLFYALLALGAAAIVGGAVALRLRHLRARFAAVLDERRRIARDLHDTLAQIFAAIGFQTSALLDEGRAPAERRALAEQLRRIVAHGRRSARGVVWNLRSGGGESRSLERAVEELTGMYEGARVSLSITGEPFPLPLESESDVLYIAQQAVSNAIEHGPARHVGIELEYAPGRFALWVRDDGKGFPPERGAEAGHYGMAMMRERAERIGGTLVVESAPEAGTEIGVVVDGRRAPKERNR